MPPRASRAPPAAAPVSTAAYALRVTIPRAEEVHERPGIAKAAARTVYVLQASCRDADGESRSWQLKKRFGYFDRLHRTALRHAGSAAMANVPPPPRRKLLSQHDPAYLAELRAELEAFVASVVGAMCAHAVTHAMPLLDLLELLELPPDRTPSAWEARGAG